MMTKDTMICPVNFRTKPILVAVDYYRQHSGVPFFKDLCDYMVNGFVYSGADCFGMGKVIEIEKDGKKQPAWFIRMAVGELNDLFRVLPFYLPWMRFCRRGETRVREYSTDRLFHLGTLKERRKEERKAA